MTIEEYAYLADLYLAIVYWISPLFELLPVRFLQHHVVQEVGLLAYLGGWIGGAIAILGITFSYFQFRYKTRGHAKPGRCLIMVIKWVFWPITLIVNITKFLFQGLRFVVSKVFFLQVPEKAEDFFDEHTPIPEIKNISQLKNTDEENVEQNSGDEDEITHPFGGITVSIGMSSGFDEEPKSESRLDLERTKKKAGESNKYDKLSQIRKKKKNTGEGKSYYSFGGGGISLSRSSDFLE